MPLQILQLSLLSKAAVLELPTDQRQRLVALLADLLVAALRAEVADE